MKIRKLVLTLILASIVCIGANYAQITGVRYNLKYNTATCRYDMWLHFTGTATTAVQRSQFNSQISFVMPTGTFIEIPTTPVNFNYLPLNNNTNYTGTQPLRWTVGSTISNPNDGNDYVSVTPTLSPTSQYNNIANGDSLRIFSVRFTTLANCGTNLRLYENGVDPGSSAPGMQGGDFSQGFTIGSTAQRYISNLPQQYPPKPALTTTPTCNTGLEIDLTATVPSCQSPVTYTWSGPNGFSASTQDVNIPNAPEIASGIYMVTVTDAAGCSSTRSVQATAKPSAGPNAFACANSSVTLNGNSPATGTWVSAPTNPPGVTVGPSSGGTAVAALSPTANGLYNFLYTVGACADTTAVTITEPNAGTDPAAVNCFSNGVASLAAIGSTPGVWTVDPLSSGTAVIANPSSASTTVSNFSVPGVYILTWTTAGCSDDVFISVGSNCNCSIASNSITAPVTSSFCGNTAPLTLDGSTATPSGGTYLWQYSLNNGTYSTASGTSNSEDYSTTGLGVGVHRLRRIYSITGGSPCSDTSNIVLLTVNATPATPLNMTATPNPICIGSSANLTVTQVAGVTYTWSAPPAAGLAVSSTNVNTMLPTAVGTYTVSVTASVNGCTSNAATVAVVVAEKPFTPSQSNFTGVNPTTCATPTGSITITGFTPNTGYTVTFKRNGVTQSVNVVSNGTGAIFLGGLTAGTYTEFIISNAAGCMSNATNAVVTLVDPSAPPAPSGLTATPNPLCLGGTVALSVTNNPGAVYAWTASNVTAGLTASTTNTTSMLPTASGFYTVSVTQTVGGCVSGPATVGVSVNPSPPTPTALTTTGTNPTACGGTNGFISLSGYTANTAFTVTYTAPAGPQSLNVTANGSGIIIIPNLVSGAYTNFRVANATLCQSGVFAGPVNLSDPNSPTPPAGLTATPNPSCLGTLVNLSATNVAGSTYTWSTSSGTAGLGASTTNTNTMTATAAGVYTINVTRTVSGCTSAPSTVDVTVQSVPPTPTAGSITPTNPTTCNGTNGSIALSGLTPNTSFTINYSKNGTPTSATLVANASGIVTILNLTAGAYSNFSVVSGAGCASGVFAGPVTLTDPGAPSAPAGLVANPNPVCAGATVNLSVTNNPGATYTWSASDPAAGLVAATTNTTSMLSNTAGTYTISVTQNVGGCISVPATVSVVVNAVPPTPTNITSSNPTICAGSDGFITITGYTPSTAYTINYTKNGSPLVANITSNASGAIIIAGLTSGSYSGFRVSNASGCTSGTSTTTISLTDPNSPPAPAGLTAIPNPVCLGAVVNLNVTNNPGATYTWSANSPNAGVVPSTTNTTTMNATAAGSYTISVIQNVAGCTSSAANITVVVNPNPPTPSANSTTPTNPTCSNADGSITLSGLMNGSTYVVNYSNNGTPATITLVANAFGVVRISNLPVGSYSNFSVTNAQGCASGVFAGPVTLTSPGNPSAPTGLLSTPDFICLKSIVNLSVNNNTGATYQWSASSPNAGLGTSSANTNTLNPSAAGLYVVSVTQTVNGCTSPPATFNLEARGDCYNPDIDVTWIGVMTNGSVKTNDQNTMTTYGTATALPGNPSACLPVVTSAGDYTFTCTTPGLYRFNVPACIVGNTNNCENISLQITVLDFIFNNPPVVNHDYIRTKSNTPIVVNALANDRCESFPNCVLDNFTVVVNPVNGTFNAGSRTYTPNNNFIGKDSLRYRVCQTPVVTPTNCTESWIYFHIIGNANANVSNAMDDYGQAAANTILTVNAANGLKANDTDPEGNSQNIMPLTQTIAGKGSIVINADGSYVFTPEAGYVGPVFFPYETCDQGNPSACDKATLHILVERFNATGSIGNFVWHDVNGNGIQDNSEQGVPNVKVFLYDNDDNLVAQTTTSTTGAYQFDNVLASSYYLRFQPAATFSFINYGQGNDRNRDSDVTNRYGQGTSDYFTVAPGQLEFSKDAGLYICSRIGDRIWYDSDKDDIWDQNENGLNGFTVSIYKKIGNLWIFEQSTETKRKPGSISDDGWWEFCVPPGEYYVSFDIPQIQLVAALPNKGNNPNIDSDITHTFGYGTTRSFTVASGQNKLDIGAGFYPMATTGNLVWRDNNLNGIQEANEPPVSNVKVQVFDANTNEKLGESYTNNKGQYLVEYLQKRDVYLQFSVPNGLAPTAARMTLDEIDSDVDHTFGLNTTRKISLEPGKSYQNIDLGLVFAPLPVDWQDINVKRVDDYHHLTWTTAQEINTQYFEIERKLNNSIDFVSTGVKVDAAGNSASPISYDWKDKDINRFGTYYYRVKQVDLDGSIGYSNVVSIRNGGKPTIEVYPSPAVTESFVKINLTDNSQVMVEMFDPTGKQISTPFQNSVLEAGEHILPISVQQIPNGVYVIYVTIDDVKEKFKVIKID